MNTNRLNAETLQILSAINNNWRVSVLAAVQSNPGGNSCVMSANKGLKRPTGFRLRPETIDRYLSSVGELPEGICLQDSGIFPTSAISETLYVALHSMYDIEIV